MSLINETTTPVENNSGHPASRGVNLDSNFQFVPKELAIKCHSLIESYHAMHGYGCLPDMLWHSDARDVIECNRDLATIFKNASKSRCAKRANDSMLLIATVIFSLEMLARDIAGWGKRFPAAKHEAEKLLGGDFMPSQCTWLTDMYLYPSLASPVSALAPTSRTEQGPVKLAP